MFSLYFKYVACECWLGHICKISSIINAYFLLFFEDPMK